MKRFVSRLAAAAISLGAASLVAQSSSARLTIDATQNVSPVSPVLYGLMTEEINYSYDGGLYAEMVRNRTFHNRWPRYEYWTPVMRGDSKVQMEEGKDGPSAALPTSALLTIEKASAGNAAGLANAGYWGMALKPSTTYSGSFYAKPNGVGAAHARLIADDTGTVLAETTVATTDGEWKRYAYTMKTSATAKAGLTNHLEITFEQPGTIELQLVSLFPPTFHNRPNGNRSDLMLMMDAMKPHFLRLPGGNYLEGDFIKERFNWKETVGPLVDRPTHRSPWNYQSTDGMGLLEFLEWCEDLED